MTISDLTYATAAQLAAALAAGEVSSVELTDAAIARIERLDAAINAVCVRDFERAREAARQADTARARGTDGKIGALLGIPMLIKESFNIAGLPTTWGIPPFKDFIPAEDALAVSRVKAAGAVILGKTNVPLALADLQSYNGIYGATKNPWDAGRTPGGSSGGSAAALAAGYAALSIGSDIAGSLRVPAHFCGIYAHKPTYGVVPSRGHAPPMAPAIPYERDLSVVGPMARSAGDLLSLFELLAEPDPMASGQAYRLALPKPRHQALRDFRVLLIDNHPAIPTSASIRSVFDDVARKLESAGVKVKRESPLLPDQFEAARVYMRLLLSTVSASYPPELYEQMRVQAAKLGAGDRSLAAERLRGSVLSHRDWVAADSARAQLRHRWRALFAEFDIVLCPASPTSAFPHDQSPNQWAREILIDGEEHDYPDQLVWAGIASAPGLPATVLPVARDRNNLPIGMQLVGPMYEDLTTLHFARLLETELGGFVPPPLS
ncbi:MAG TPA: amidase [Herbaspirillum sp.]